VLIALIANQMDGSVVLGIIANIVNFANVFAMAIILGASTEYFRITMQNWTGKFRFHEYTPGDAELEGQPDPAANTSVLVSAENATLVWDLHHEFKFRVWHPFWNGLLKAAEEATMSQQAEPGSCMGMIGGKAAVKGILMKKVDDRWRAIKDQVNEAGITKISHGCTTKGTRRKQPWKLG